MDIHIANRRSIEIRVIEELTQILIQLFLCLDSPRDKKIHEDMGFRNNIKHNLSINNGQNGFRDVN